MKLIRCRYCVKLLILILFVFNSVDAFCVVKKVEFVKEVSINGVDVESIVTNSNSSKTYNNISKGDVTKINEINNEIDEYDEYDDYYTEIETITIKDPLEKINRKIFSFNIFILNNVGEPLIKFYNTITNQFIRDCLSNFGDRFFDPLTLINSILQLDYKNSFKTIATFTTNMTIGVFGLFNPAEYFGFYREKRTFGQTLAYYGVGNGLYLMLPFFGPSTLREGTGMLLGVVVDPFSFNLLGFDGDIGDLTPNELLVPKYIGGYSGKVDGAVKLNEQFLEKSFDPYIFARDSYIQNLHYKNINLKNNNEVENEE